MNKMAIQEKIEVLAGVSNHPNKEKLVFKIDGDWVSYQDLENSVGEEIYISDSILTMEKLSSDEVKKKYGTVYIEQGHDLDIDNRCNNVVQELVDKINTTLSKEFDLFNVPKEQQQRANIIKEIKINKE